MILVQKFFFGLTFTFWFCSALACPSENNDCTIDKKAWVNLISTKMPVEFCKADSAFMKCYKVSHARCIDLSSKLTKQCLEKYKNDMPMQFSKEDSTNWGATIGECAGDKLTDIIKFKAGKDESCLSEQL